LILGNSQAFYDLDPAFFKSKTFNGAHVAQTLDLDAAIFQKFENNLSSLKTIVIVISDMSFFFKSADSSNSWRMKNYTIYYHLHATNKFSDYFEVLSLPFSINRQRLIDYYIHHENNITMTRLGFGNNYKGKAESGLEATVLKESIIHKIKDFKNLSYETKSLEQIIASCNKKNIKVILLIPPVYSGYILTINPFQLTTTFNTCEHFKDTYKNVFYFNFLSDNSFTDTDYFDAAHLNQTGAKKISLKVDSIINELNNKKN
jgi:hypothetical protein